MMRPRDLLARVRGDDDIPPPPAESAAALGLLVFLTRHALDDDYEVVAAKSGHHPRRNRIATLLALALFAVLVFTAATQTSRNAVSDERQRADLIKQLQARQRAVSAQDASITTLQKQITQLRASLATSGNLAGGTRAQLRTLGTWAGGIPVHGPGVEIVVDNAPNASSSRQTVLDTDLQQLVNGLWQAGAEAISINGERLTTLSSIRTAGTAITVNNRSLSTPYTVDAIGDPATLPTRFADTAGGQAWLDLHDAIGLRFNVTTRTAMRLPAASTDLRYAKVARKASHG